MTSFAVMTPSRGLVHSRTVEAVMTNVAQASGVGHEFRGWHLTHDLPIPDCHEQAAAGGLATGADALWFVEEDVIPPAGALLTLFDVLTQATIAAIDYPVESGWSCVCRQGDTSGPILYCGLGCTLVRRSLFEALERPWFRSDTQFAITRFGDVRTVLMPIPHAYEYGGQDIYFCHRALGAGFTIEQVPGMTAGHCRLVEPGALATNQGTHGIKVLDEITRWQQV